MNLVINLAMAGFVADKSRRGFLPNMDQEIVLMIDIWSAERLIKNRWRGRNQLNLMHENGNREAVDI